MVDKTECEFTEVQKSDRLIVALKPAKAGGAKGATNQPSAEVKHERFSRHGKRRKRAEADKVSVGDIQQSYQCYQRVNIAFNAVIRQSKIVSRL